MKHLIIACLVLLCNAATSAEATEIKFIKAEAGQDWRSVVIEPTASIDGNTISIFSDITIQNVQVAVKDMAGNVIYANTIAIPSKQNYSFSLDDIESGNYVLEVIYMNKYYYGYFVL